jgi:hypothetical protein
LPSRNSEVTNYYNLSLYHIMNKMLIDYIRPDGQFETANGTFFVFVYEFAGGLLGTANHKTANSPFAVGQEVYVEVVGQSPKGVSKLKLSKNPPDPRFAAAPAAPAPAAAPVTRSFAPIPKPSSPSAALGTMHPATSGMAVKEACALIGANGSLELAYLAGNEFAEQLFAVARNIARVAIRLEGSAIPPAAAAPAAPAPKPAARPDSASAPRPKAGPVEVINDEDVPF